MVISNFFTSSSSSSSVNEAFPGEENKALVGIDVDDIGVIGVGSEYSRSCSTATITSSFFGEG